MNTPRAPRIYLASSWRNDHQQRIVTLLRYAGFTVYDFRNPTPAATGFHWSEVGIDSQGETPATYLAGLKHPIATTGFLSDFDAMQAADIGVLLLPCGKSAHSELGWMAGMGKRTAVLLESDMVEPELMYRLYDFVTASYDVLKFWLRFGSPPAHCSHLYWAKGIDQAVLP